MPLKLGPFKINAEEKYRAFEEKLKSKNGKDDFVDDHGFGGGSGRHTSFDYSKSNVGYSKLSKNDEKKK